MISRFSFRLKEGSEVISFVVPAYNEELCLGPTLTAIHTAARACCERYEIVVADDASSDSTAAVAELHGARVIHVEHRQIAATRNAGARAATGELLVFVDADTLVNPAVIRATVRAIASGAIGGGCAFRFDEPLPFYARLLGPPSVQLYHALGLAAGCYLFCTRRAFQAIGGFDERLFAAEEAFASQALQRQGRFVILRQAVTTSGRKLRAYTGREILNTLAHLAISGTRAVRQRAGLDLWYGQRRADPAHPGPNRAAMS
jgi:glycosyltransferase involved in cell wall biosynthesis